MEKEINIAEILKDKPEDTELWTDMFGRVTLYVVTDACDAFQVNHHNKEPWFDKDGKFCKEGVLCIYPSKSMRDWHKFAWKKGDVLVSNDGKREVLFKTWVNDSYTKFVGLHCLIINDNEEVEYDNGTTVFNTNDFKGIEAEDAVQTYINTIEERFGGKINRETLEVEKPQPEFKDGDIVALVVRKCTHIAIFQLRQKAYIVFHAVLCQNDELLLEEPFREDVGDIELRLATDSEKQQLFAALEKEGKRWDAEKKEVVGLKPKFDELKPFDKVLVRNTDTEEWFPGFFEEFDSAWNKPYHIMNLRSMTDFAFEQCIPYKGNEHLLGTRNNPK